METNETNETTERRQRGQVAHDAAVVYEDFFVPALFEQWAEPLLDAAHVEPGHSVLDVGCGTGIAARRAVDRVGPSGSVIGIDPNEGMLAVARSCAPKVDWRSGVAESLPVPDDHVDRTISQFAAMFFEDRIAAVDEMVRVTRPGGRVAIATWADVDTSPGYAAMVQLLGDQVGAWAAEAMRAPFTIGSEEALRAVLHGAGERVTVTTHHGVARFRSIEAWLHTDVRGWTLADGIDDDAFNDLLAAAREPLADFAAADGTVAFDAPAIFGVIDV